MGIPGRLSLPRFALYGDGTLIVPADTDGAIPTAQVRHLTKAAVTGLRERARAAGLDTARSYPSQMPDAPVLVVTFGQARTRITDPERSEVARAVTVDLDALEVTGPPTPYSPTTFAVNASPTSTDSAKVRPWPLDPLDSGTPLDMGLCTTYPTARLLPVAGPAGLWTDRGTTYRVFIRPLLPGEPDCAALSR
ncbi:hypothetical protein Acsp05_64050 [Actinokineospora sp. NBRC 105648]|nr:hypothetical protein Acsp05_64050 [Actinokineospora sp. NBRC 105648]